MNRVLQGDEKTEAETEEGQLRPTSKQRTSQSSLKKLKLMMTDYEIGWKI